MNRKGTGLVHIYFGDGKGKTTTGMGLCVRAAGYGYRVLIYQFMKNNKTSERNILEKIENVSNRKRTGSGEIQLSDDGTGKERTSCFL